MKRYKFQTWLVGSAIVILMAGCVSISRIPRETELGSHHVSVVPSCQHASTTSHRLYASDGSSTILFYEFNCGDTFVRLDGNALSVNGKSYGTLNEGDAIVVNYGKVRVNSTARAAK